MASLIRGSYAYHHYIHEGLDDSGWKCSYQYIQILIIWFTMQSYISVDVQPHVEIQQEFVEIGDKDPSFIRSCALSGASELNLVLHKLISCKIINVMTAVPTGERWLQLVDMIGSKNIEQAGQTVQKSKMRTAQIFQRNITR